MTLCSDDNTCRGYSSFLDASQAKKQKQVSFYAHVHVKSIKRTRGMSKDKLLCAAVHEQNKAFTAGVNKLFSSRYIFSTTLRRELEAQFRERSGALGLPGSLVPEPALIVLKRMRATLDAVVTTHVEAVKHVVSEAWIRSISKAFGEFPSLYAVVKSNVENALNTQVQLAREAVKSILAWEESCVFTENHYFMDTVQSLRKALLSGERILELPDEFSCLGDDAVRKLRSLSNEEQRIVDVQIEIFAYWKVMKKRFIDYVAMACQHEMVRKPLKGMFAQAIQSAVEDACAGSDGLVQLMAPTESKRFKLEQMTTRLKALSKAKDLLRSQAFGIDNLNCLQLSK
eukprot:TRINITY_DN47275_c0_g1_i1.p1 TRINITY_DN47275_c0_g1~~TRINITY_DN47275_c0_g1_i1.p1  ORF type:complete len:384 (+),score=48.79 TRINITY_DN47275_c0_g1_i1:127-1152(+)